MKMTMIYLYSAVFQESKHVCLNSGDPPPLGFIKYSGPPPICTSSPQTSTMTAGLSHRWRKYRYQCERNSSGNVTHDGNQPNPHGQEDWSYIYDFDNEPEPAGKKY